MLQDRLQYYNYGLQLSCSQIQATFKGISNKLGDGSDTPHCNSYWPTIITVVDHGTMVLYTAEQPEQYCSISSDSPTSDDQQ